MQRSLNVLVIGERKMKFLFFSCPTQQIYQKYSKKQKQMTSKYARTGKAHFLSSHRDVIVPQLKNGVYFSILVLMLFPDGTQNIQYSPIDMICHFYYYEAKGVMYIRLSNEDRRKYLRLVDYCTSLQEALTSSYEAVPTPHAHQTRESPLWLVLASNPLD